MPSEPEDSYNDSGGPLESGEGLSALVATTGGLQPARRLFHAASGTGMVLILTFLDLSRGTALWLLGAALVVQAALDGTRLLLPRVNAAFFRVFRSVASPREAAGPASSTWYTLGVLLSVALFPREGAITGILVLAYADPAASYGGRRWGRRGFLGGSLEGSAVFAAVTIIAVGARHGLAVALGAAVLLTLVERLSWPLDDNLTLPVATAGLVTLLESLL